MNFAIVDLELIGDYAYEIATLSSSMKALPASQILAQFQRVGAKIEEILARAIEGWRESVPAKWCARKNRRSGANAEPSTKSSRS
jgi:hypothetical protein